jgi:integrase
MPRYTQIIPPLKLHKASNRAYVMLDCRRVYCGAWGSAEARRKYDLAIAEWLAQRAAMAATPASADEAVLPVPAPLAAPAAAAAAARSAPPAIPASPAPREAEACLTVNELLTRFWDHAQTYYRRPDGTPTSEVEAYRQALRWAYELYGPTPVAAFGARSLMALRDAMIRGGWCRTTVNRGVQRVRAAFRWGVEQELVPAGVYHSLQAVRGLRAGRSDAEEPESVEPVPVDVVERTLPFLSATLQAMVKVQLRTGCRAGELIQMRPMDIDRSGAVWIYRPAQHKTKHHGLERLIYLDKVCQELLADRLDRAPNACVFSPKEAEAERKATLAASRKTPLNQGNRPGYGARARAGGHPRRAPGDMYTVASFRRAIARSCDEAFPLPPQSAAVAAQVEAWHKAFTKSHKRPARRAEVPADLRKKEDALLAERARRRWHPHQLRHTAATVFRQTYGLEVARVLLGHQDTKMTRHYSRPDHEEALRQLAGNPRAA